MVNSPAQLLEDEWALVRSLSLQVNFHIWLNMVNSPAQILEDEWALVRSLSLQVNFHI